MKEMEDKYMSLITDYLDGVLTEERQKEFHGYVESGLIDLKEVEQILAIQQKMIAAPVPEPSVSISENFYQMLEEEGNKLDEKTQGNPVFSQMLELLFGTIKGRLAFGISVLAVGLLIGRLFTGSVYNGKLDRLSNEMAEMKEVMMMAMLDEESVSQRLKGVQMSNGLVNKNKEVVDALFLTLNNDRSTNVRLASLATLSEYTDDPEIREGLIKSISQQKSPLVQVALAELMVALQENQALDEFEPILNAENTPDDVKSALRQNLDKIM